MWIQFLFFSSKLKFKFLLTPCEQGTAYVATNFEGCRSLIHYSFKIQEWNRAHCTLRHMIQIIDRTPSFQVMILPNMKLVFWFWAGKIPIRNIILKWVRPYIFENKIIRRTLSIWFWNSVSLTRSRIRIICNSF